MKDTTRNTYLAVDFGGGSGRVIAGSLLQGKLELELNNMVDDEEDNNED